MSILLDARLHNVPATRSIEADRLINGCLGRRIASTVVRSPVQERGDKVAHLEVEPFVALSKCVVEVETDDRPVFHKCPIQAMYVPQS